MKTSEYILQTARDYAIYVCDQRALPRVSDGLKSVQRKALWIARKHREKIKTISLAGEMISSGLYVHGDSSASQAISLMAAKYCNNICWFEGHGAFGTIVDPKSFGAPRYTYVKLSKAAKEIMLVDEEIIPLQENYDGSTYEPETFLPLIPTVLLNGIAGIAIGWSTEILPHSLIDIIDATIAVLKGNEISNIRPFYNHYDIEIKKINESSYELRGKIEKIGKNRISINSIPPEITIEQIKTTLTILMEKNIVIDYEDLSTDKINIIVKFKRDILEKYSIEELIDLLKLKTIKHERIVVIDFDGKTIKQYENHYQLIKKFIEWRKKFLRKRFEYKIDEINRDLEKLESYISCYEKKLAQKIIKMDSKEMNDEIKKILKTDKKELIDYIKNLPIYRWNREEYEKRKKEKEKLIKEKEKYEKILKSEKKIEQVYLKELEELKKKYS